MCQLHDQTVSRNCHYGHNMRTVIIPSLDTTSRGANSTLENNDELFLLFLKAFFITLYVYLCILYLEREGTSFFSY